MFIPNQIENDPIAVSSESSNPESNSVALSPCRGDSCGHEITPVHSGDGYEDNSVLTDDEDYSVSSVVPVINLDKSKNTTSAMSATTSRPSATINTTQAKTFSMATSTVFLKTTNVTTALAMQTTSLLMQTTPLPPLNITTSTLQTVFETEMTSTNGTTLKTTSTSIVSTTTTSTTTITTTLAPKPNIHIWIQGGDGFGDSAKVYFFIKRITLV